MLRCDTTRCLFGVFSPKSACIDWLKSSGIRSSQKSGHSPFLCLFALLFRRTQLLDRAFESPVISLITLEHTLAEHTLALRFDV